MNSGIREDQQELDLIGLLHKLWQGRYILLIVIVLTLALSSGWLILRPEKWTSSAVITRPEPGDAAMFIEAVRTSQSEGGSANNQQDILIRLFNRVVANISDGVRDNRSPFYIKPMTKGGNDAFVVTYTARSPYLAQQGLEKLLAKVGQSVKSDAFASVNNMLKVRQRALEKSLAVKFRSAREQNCQRLIALRNALTVATAVNLQQAVPTQDIVNDEMLFLLGAPALRIMIENAENWPLPYNESYFHLNEELQLVKNFQLKNSDVFNAFRYIQKPELPVYRDGPGVMRILALALLLGAVIGGALVLIRDAFRTHLNQNGRCGNAINGNDSHSR